MSRQTTTRTQKHTEKTFTRCQQKRLEEVKVKKDNREGKRERTGQKKDRKGVWGRKAKNMEEWNEDGN